MRGLRSLRARGGDRGSAAIEVLGAIPVVAIVLVVLVQGAAAVYTTQATNQAVRDGARALSLGRSAPDAVEDSLPGGLRADTFATVNGGQGVRITVKVPRIGVFPEMTVDRSAVMPGLVP